MLLTISTNAPYAQNLGWLLHKHPDKLQTFDIAGGKAHVFYPEANDLKCTAALLVELDSIGLVKKLNAPGNQLSLEHYVNDRPYVGSSFVSTAITKVFSSALNGNCNNKPQLVKQVMPLTIELNVLSVKGNFNIINKIFEPLEYEVDFKPYLLDEKFPDWGVSRYCTLRLTATKTLQEVLTHLYVLLPVFDNDKHYYVSNNDIEKLLNKGKDWLINHPEKKLITYRYLKNLKGLANKALKLLSIDDTATNEEELIDNLTPATEEKVKKVRLHELRLLAAKDALKESGAQKVLDLGCGEGKLIRHLMKETQFTQITGLDVTYQSLLRAKERLYFDHLSPKIKERIQLLHGSLMYKDERLLKHDAAALVEVIEHIELDRLDTFEKIVFDYLQLKTIIISTPNAEYNAVYEFLEDGNYRHDDHRFEWTRAEFKQWCNSIAETYNYEYIISFIGDENEEHGTPSQMAIFNKKS